MITGVTMETELGQVHLQTLLSQTEAGVAATDADGNMTLLSPLLQKLFGLPYQSVPEAEIAEYLDLYAADGRTPLPPEEVPLARARAGELVRDTIISARLADGSLLYLRCNAAPLRGEDGKIDGAIVLAQDVSAEIAALREQEELRSRLVVTINHEFRTPLAALLGHAELLHDLRDELPPAARRSLDRVLSSGQRLADLVQTVSELVDLEADTHLTRTKSDVSGIVRDAASLLRTAARDRSVDLVVDVPGRLPALVDPGKLAKAVLPLLENAVTYAPESSRVVVSARGDGLWLHVTVTDAGTGIEPREVARLVQPFERGDHPLQPVNSRGLGLAVAHAVAAAHGGRLTLEKRRPHGLRARLTVPRFGSVPLGSAELPEP